VLDGTLDLVDDGAMPDHDHALIGSQFSWNLPLTSGGVEAELDDGTSVFIRPIRADDAPALENAFAEMSPRSRYLRFFTVRNHLGRDLTTKLTDIDHDRHRAWVAADVNEPSTVGSDEGRGIAVARLVVVDDEPNTAEAALAVVDDHQGRGLGRLMLDLLISTARATDIEFIRFETLAENEGMRALLAELGAETNRALTDHEVLVYDLPVGSPRTDDAMIIGSLYEILRFIAASDDGDATG